MKTEKVEKGRNPLVSVIIPVYNAERYLERCLRSVTGQTYSDLQIILVDDGSTDQSREICEKWKTTDSRIEVIHNRNVGPGMARNAGIERAEGSYLTFVDSDDYVEPQIVEVLLKPLLEQETKVCFCGHIEEKGNGSCIYGIPPQKLDYSGYREMITFLKYVLSPSPEKTDRGFTGMFAWGAMYEASLFEDGTLRFSKERLCEDLFFILAVCKSVNHVLIAPYCMYHYCIHENSLMQKYQKDRFNRAKEIRQCLEYELKGEISEDPEMGLHIDRNYMDYLIGCMKVEIRFWRQEGNIRRCYEELRKMTGDEITQQILRRYPIKRMASKQKLLFFVIRHRWIRMIYWLFCFRYKL